MTNNCQKIVTVDFCTINYKYYTNPSKPPAFKGNVRCREKQKAQMEALFDVRVFHTDVNISSDKVLENSEKENRIS